MRGFDRGLAIMKHEVNIEVGHASRLEETHELNTTLECF